MDIVTPRLRSRIMSQVKSDGNRSTELRMMQILKRAGITGWRRRLSVYGKPDFVFPHARVAVFVDGCFWHGCSKHCRMPHSKRAYWEAKIERNKERDKQTTRFLRKTGWLVIRLWEHDLSEIKNPRGLQRLKAALQAHRGSKKLAFVG